MGYSPLTGLVMSTRSGDIDPMLAIYLMSVYGYHSDGLERLLNKMSGLLGVSEVSSDIRDLVHVDEEGNEGDKQSELALKMYIHRLKKYVGSYIFALKGMDVLIFTDDIGVQNWLVREKVCEGLNWCGLIIDKEENRNAPTDRIVRLNAKDSQVHILSIPTDEEIVIYREGLNLLEGE
jgi:acetate kinase